MQDVLDPKLADKTFSKKLGKYAEPVYALVIAAISTCIFAITAPLFGWFLMKVMAEINISYFFGESVIDAALPWCLVMLLASIIMWIFKSLAGVMIVRISENITMNIRAELYESVVRKEIGWHDDRENSSGVMTATLASDVQLLNGVSSEGMTVQIESGVALLTGVVGAFIFSWPMALCSIGLTPLIMICGAIAAKADQEEMMNVKAAESSDDVTED